MTRETTRRPVRVGAEEEVYRDRYQRIVRVAAQFDGFAKEYFILDRGVRTSVLVVRGWDVLLVRQYRFVVDGLTLEIPSGRVDGGERPEDAARRECLEETGVVCRSVRPLILFQPGVDTLRHPSHVFLCEDFEEGAVPSEIERVWIPLDEAVARVFSGGIVDSLSVIALLACRLERQTRGGGA